MDLTVNAVAIAIDIIRGRADYTPSGGRQRQALFMPALIAARFNPDLNSKYQQMVTAGKPAKVAITTVMRKLVVTANALLKADRLWQQARA